MSRERRSVAFFISIVFLASIFIGPERAFASRVFHYDLSGGGARFSNASEYYGLSSGKNPPNGTAFGQAIYYDPVGKVSLFRAFFGLNHKYFFANPNSRSKSTMAIYPSIRFSFWLFYFTAGYSPFVWSRTSEDWGIQGFSMSQKTSAYLGEAGVEIPLVPIVSVISAASAQIINTAGTRSPNPVIDVSFGFRFYFGKRSKKSRSGYGGFAGWRYPFGIERY